MLQSLDCPHGNNRKINATQKKTTKNNESKIKSDSFGSNEGDQLEMPPDPDSEAGLAKKRMRRRNKREVESIKTQEQLDADGSLESERRKKFMKNVGVKNTTGFDSSNVSLKTDKNSLIDNKDNNTNKIKFDGLGTYIPALSASQVYSSSSLLRKAPSNPCENAKQASLYLLNINGVVVPTILPTDKLNFSPSSQKNICYIQTTGNTNFPGSSLSVKSNQSEREIEEKKERTQIIEGQSLLKTITQSNEEQSSFTNKQVSVQSSSSSGQDNTSSPNDKNKEKIPMKVENKSIITINVNKTSKNTILVTSTKGPSSLSGPGQLQKNSNIPIKIGCSRRLPEKESKNEIQTLYSTTQKGNGIMNLISSKSKEISEEKSTPIHKGTSDEQELSDSAKSTLNKTQSREPSSIADETLPTDKNISEGEIYFSPDQISISNNSKLKDESQVGCQILTSIRSLRM